MKNILLLLLLLLFVKILIFKGNLNASFYKSYSDTNIAASLSKTVLDSSKLKEELIDSMIVFAKEFIGLPYRYKGYDKSGFDCSGYIHYVYNKFGIEVPRSSVGLASIGKKIELSDVKKGDLLFFQGRNIKNKNIGHVSMVIDVDDKSVTMIHSTRRGIIIDRLNEINYYKTRFITARHLNL
jgi:cell wall-associated NlpC family hydrolase